MGVQIPMERGNFEGEESAPAGPTTLCRELCKMAEQIDLLFGLWTRVGRRKQKFNCIRQVAPICTLSAFAPYGVFTRCDRRDDRLV